MPSPDDWKDQAKKFVDWAFYSLSRRYFLLVSVAIDLVLTAIIINSGKGYEANPIANWIITIFGLPGLAVVYLLVALLVGHLGKKFWIFRCVYLIYVVGSIYAVVNGVDNLLLTLLLGG